MHTGNSPAGEGVVHKKAESKVVSSSQKSLLPIRRALSIWLEKEVLGVNRKGFQHRSCLLHAGATKFSLFLALPGTALLKGRESVKKTSSLLPAIAPA